MVNWRENGKGQKNLSSPAVSTNINILLNFQYWTGVQKYEIVSQRENCKRAIFLIN
jgi:hypothetical protein